MILPFDWQTWIAAAPFVFGGLTLLWAVSAAIKNASIIDIAWGPGFLVCAIVYATFSHPLSMWGWLTVALVAIWAIRLALHIGIRNHGKGEDPRYAKWRHDGGPGWVLRSLVTVFWLQGVLMWVISVPFVATAAATQLVYPWLAVVGLVVWLVGFLFEAVADWQLTRFKADPENKGKLFTGGLWQFSRHPNYFGECVLWWGYFLIAVSTGAWWALIAPVVMTFLLLKVSGVTLLEQSQRVKPGYERYVRETNAFLPWFRKA